MAPKKRTDDTGHNTPRRSRRLKAQYQDQLGSESLLPLTGSRVKVRRLRRDAQRPSAAQQAVLTTAELLENVLVHLPMLDILTAQRACRLFRDVVTDSIILQRKLFSVADAPLRRWSITQQGAGGDRYYVFRNITAGLREGRQEGQEELTPVNLNPLLAQQHKPVGHRLDAGCASVLTLRGGTRVASWRRMHISDPPAKQLVATVEFTTPNVSIHSVEAKVVVGDDTEDVDNQPAITLGDVVDQVLEDGIQISHGGKKCFSHEKGIVERVRKDESMDGGDAYIRAGWLKMELRRTVVPSEVEWRAMNEDGEITYPVALWRPGAPSALGLETWINNIEMARYRVN